VDIFRKEASIYDGRNPTLLDDVGESIGEADTSFSP
jgi:hypothetical protein